MLYNQDETVTWLEFPNGVPMSKRYFETKTKKEQERMILLFGEPKEVKGKPKVEIVKKKGLVGFLEQTDHAK